MKNLTEYLLEQKNTVKELSDISKSDLKFKKLVLDDEDESIGNSNSPDLHEYICNTEFEYYVGKDIFSSGKSYKKGDIAKASPYISEFYNDRCTGIGGYQIYFDKSNVIATFKTLDEAINGLVKYINFLRTEGHDEPKWIYNQNKGTYQWTYQI